MFAARHNVALAAVVTFPLLGASAAQAAPITYDFTVTGTSGPLNGTAAHGTFSYDFSSIVPRGSSQATGLLTSLSFPGMGYPTIKRRQTLAILDLILVAI